MERLERPNGAKLDLFVQMRQFFTNGRFTTVPWDELEGLPEKDLEDTAYWSLTPDEIEDGSRRWRTLAHRNSPKPNKQTRYALVKLFGSTRRAKVFVEWVRASTSRKHSEAFRWNRCRSCGSEIAFLALDHGDVGCHGCGAPNDSTIYGDERLSPHMAYARIVHINGMQASSFGGRRHEMPDFSITRGEK